MAEDLSSKDHVLISLTTLTPEIMPFPERRIVLTGSSPTLQIGRASNRLALGLQSETANAWFDSPVMSRNHARISADIANKGVYIEDMKSMHGTYLNGEKVSHTERRPLTPGDKLVFGMPVYRNEQTFQPAEVQVGFEFHAAPQSTTSPSRIFSVPDDCSTDENEPLEEEFPMLTTKTTVEATASAMCTADAHKDLLTEPPAMPQLDGPVDTEITLSEVPRPSQSNDNDDTIWDDDQSIRLTESSCSSSEYSSHAPSSPESVRGPVEPVFMAYHANEFVSESWSNNSTGGVDEDARSKSSREEGSLQEDVFIYDSEDSEEMDPGCDLMAEDSEDVDFDEYAPMEEDSETEEPLGVSKTVGNPCFGPFSLPPINEALPWSSGSIHRAPSPSDAVLLYAHHRRAVEEELEVPRFGIPAEINGLAPAAINRNVSYGEVSTHSLGQISGKPEFFQAREQNKTALAQALIINRTPTRFEQSTDQPVAEHLPRQGARDACNVKDHPLAPPLDTAEFLLTRPEKQHRDSVSWTPSILPLPPSQPLSSVAALNNWDCDDWYPTSAYELEQLRKQQQQRVGNISCSPCSSGPVASGCTKDVDFQPSALPNVHLLPNSTGSRAGAASDVPRGLTSPPSVLSLSRALITEIKTPIMDAQQGRENNREPSDFVPSTAGDGLTTSPPMIQGSVKGKRKADEISKLTEEEMDKCSYVGGSSQVEEIDEVRFHHPPITDGPIQSIDQSDWLSRMHHSPQQSPAGSPQLGLPSPPTTPNEQTDPEPRPNKRVKRIAERVGFAALGGATVGALVLSSLIYTAPSFV